MNGGIMSSATIARMENGEEVQIFNRCGKLIPFYPKTENVFNRNKDDPNFVDLWSWRREEFKIIKSWHITEKVDGMNIRIAISPLDEVFIGGKGPRADIPKPLLAELSQIATVDRMRLGIERADEVVTLFGEGYGPGIQKGGDYVASGVGPQFVLFDVKVGGMWLEPDHVQSIAEKLMIRCVPVLNPAGSVEAAIALATQISFLAASSTDDTIKSSEGVVARAPCGMLDRRGNRIMWKLKARDILGRA